MQIAEFRAELNVWLDAHAGELAPTYAAPGTLDEHIAQMQRVKSVLYDAGWMRWGWPERVGGLGGSPMLRTELGAAIAARDLDRPRPVLTRRGAGADADRLRARRNWPPTSCPRLLSGAELWCQGFSEPGTGSDLSALSCRAVPDGDPATAATWVINGQKVWTSLAQYSDRCVLLTRTGAADSRHRGITAFFVDMDTPGITVVPLEMINGVLEFAEVYFDDVVVPADRMLGDLNGGWSVAMSILPYERSSCFWARIAYLYRRLQLLVEAVPADDRAADVVGDAFVQLYALRAAVARDSAPAGGGRNARRGDVDRQGPRRHRGAGDLRRGAPAPPGTIEIDDGAAGEMWRSEYLYSRAATIYGGTAEVQRNIIARRLLDLGTDE